MSSIVDIAVPNVGISGRSLMQIAVLIEFPEFTSLIFTLVACGVLPKYWLIYLPHFYINPIFLRRMKKYQIGVGVLSRLLSLPGQHFVLHRHNFLITFQQTFFRINLNAILPKLQLMNSFGFASIHDFLRLLEQTSQTLSLEMQISSSFALIVNRHSSLFTSLSQFIPFRNELQILRGRFDWLQRSPGSDPQMFFSIVNLMIEAWNPSQRWMYNGRNLFCILLLIMDPAFLPEFRLDEIESAMRSILSGGDPFLFPTYLNLPFIFFLQRSEFYEELKRMAPEHPDFAALETMTLSDLLKGCGTFENLSRFMNLSPYRMGQSTFRWNIPNTFEILGKCFSSREFCYHHALLDNGCISMTIMMYHSFLEFYERFCLPLHLLFHQEPDFRMSLDITYVPYKRIRDILFRIFPAFLMKMDIGQKFIFVSNGGEVIQRPHLLLAYFQMYSYPNLGHLTDARKMEMIVENLHAFSSQDSRTLLREYTKMFHWTVNNQLMPCLFSMFLVNMFCENVPKFLKELGMNLSSPPAYLSPVHSMQKLLANINIVSETLGMPQLTNFSSFVEQAEYNRRLPTGFEQYLIHEITGLIVPSNFRGSLLQDNLQLEIRCERRPSLWEILFWGIV